MFLIGIIRKYLKILNSDVDNKIIFKTSFFDPLKLAVLPSFINVMKSTVLEELLFSQISPFLSCGFVKLHHVFIQ